GTIKETITTAVKETIETAIDEKITKTVKEAIEASTQETITTNIKETIDRTDTRTYASVTGTPASEPQTTRVNRVREIQQRNQERKEQRRREASKLEVVLTTQDADPAVKEKLQQQTHAEITAKLQQMVNSQVKENPPQIPGITKLAKSQDIRLTLPTEQEAEILRNLKWDKYYKGLMTKQTKFGIVVSGISTKSIDPSSHANSKFKKELEDQNSTIGLEILGIKILQRNLKANAE